MVRNLSREILDDALARCPFPNSLFLAIFSFPNLLECEERTCCKRRSPATPTGPEEPHSVPLLLSLSHDFGYNSHYLRVWGISGLTLMFFGGRLEGGYVTF